MSTLLAASTHELELSGVASNVRFSAVEHECMVANDHPVDAEDPTWIWQQQAIAESDVCTPSPSQDSFKPRNVGIKFTADVLDVGMASTVRRTIGTPKLLNLDPFMLLDEFRLVRPMGFDDHPHRGFEHFTYVFPSSRGSMQYEDFLGNKGDTRPGDVNWVTPGRGIVHTERPASETHAHGVQLWVNLPTDKKNMEPSSQKIDRETIPHVFDASKKVEAIVLSGEVFGRKGPIETHHPVTFVHFILQQNAELEFQIPVGQNTMIHTLRGSGVCGNEAITQHDTVVLDRQHEDSDGLRLTTDAEDGLEVIMISGEPLNQPLVQYNLFVLSTQEEIQQTFDDVEFGRNGFERGQHWVSDLAADLRH
ncbi:hypothetical protein BBJ28_00026013 [Nothophytophthora sp. Chile5]|nr:hypothetical protein BBJ28_00026013 [Nothophytophthora sp. Chile5]